MLFRSGNAGRADYPRMLYNPDGRTMVVDSAAAHDALAKEGWSQTPAPIHTGRRPTPSPMANNGDPIVAQLRAMIERILDERGLTAAHALNVAKLAGAEPGEPPQMSLPSRRR